MNHTCQPQQGPQVPPQLQNPLPNPTTGFGSARSQPWVPRDIQSCLGDKFGLPALLGHSLGSHTICITWVDDGEDHVTVSLLSFQPIQLLLLVTLPPLILLLLSHILEGKACENGVGKATSVAGGADRAGLAPGGGELQYVGSNASRPTWIGGTSRTLFTFFRDSGTYHSVALFVTFFAPEGRRQRVTVLMVAALCPHPAQLQPRAGCVLAVLPAQAAPSLPAPAGLRLRVDVTMHFWQINPARSWLPQQQQEKGLFQAEGSHGQQIRQEELKAGFSFLC